MLVRNILYGHTHLFSLAIALTQQSAVDMFTRKWDNCVGHTGEAIEISEQYDFPWSLSVSRVLRALALACSSGEDTLAEMKEGLAGLAGTGQQAGAPTLLWTLARVQQERGRQSEALGAVESALATSARGNQPFYDAELLRLKGELLLPKDEAQAESYLPRGLEVAQRQEAKFFELRTATNLARLWQKQGKKDEARALLAPIYDWFTEGFDTADLKDAKTLLEELGR